MIYAKNNQVAKKGEHLYTPQLTYTLDHGVFAQKLTVNVKTEEDEESNLLFGPAILQTTEDPQYVFSDEYFTQQFLELGFWSKSFATPITAFRLRAAIPADYSSSQTPIELPSLFDIVAYG